MPKAHECFREEAHIMYCIDCNEFVCEHCFTQNGQSKHSPDCQGEGPKHLSEVSLYVVQSFTNQLDDIRLLRNKLDKLLTSDPFAKEVTDMRATSLANTITTHTKIYRQGCDLIENVFMQLRQLIDKVQIEYKKNFKA